MTDQQDGTPIRFQISDRAWALAMCLIVGVSASSTAYFVANVMKDNYMNGLRAGLEISGLMTRVEERKKIFYNQVPEQKTKIQPANENARLEN